VRVIFDPIREHKILNQLIKDGLITSPIAEVWEKEISAVKVDSSNSFIVNQIKRISQVWGEVESNFLKKLSSFYGQELILPPDLTCYLVRFDKYPYQYRTGPKWFCAPLFGNPAERNRVIMHELCHFFMPFESPRPFKEAVPVILNDHENFLMFGFDRGHPDPEEQDWRKKIWDHYKTGGKLTDLQRLLEKRGA